MKIKYLCWKAQLSLATIISSSCLISLFTALPSQAQTGDRLPPPPSPRSRINSQLSKPKIEKIRSSQTNNDQEREYTFSAPKVNSNLTNEAQSYRVEVFDAGSRLLPQVRNIEPTAFQNGTIIQVGIFSDRENAESLVKQLALQGLWSRIVIGN